MKARLAQRLADGLASAFLSNGAWTRRALITRGAAAIGDEPKWMGVLVEGVLARFPDPPRHRFHSLARFVALLPLLTRQEKLKPRPVVRSPVADLAMGEPRWDVPPIATRAAGTLTATTDAYARIQADLASIRAQVPELASIVTRKQWVTNQISMGVDDVGLAAMNAGTYHGWDCVNARYGSSDWEGHTTSFTPSTNSVTIRFGGRRLNIPLVVVAYSSLPHRIGWIGPNKFIGDGNDVCASRSGDTYSYVFKKGEGDCPSGCTEETYWGFSTSPGGTVTTLGKSGPEAPPPDWLQALPTCNSL
jgi:hypothetical protein